ncbi:MAG TPA: YceH family protein [Pyrinomonadaceae bacterium]|nr:YceH family protein [Pyrinomonadaceae bacterium]
MAEEFLLNDVEVRVLGSLIEKQMTTPEYYPLTLNALTHACNQISNREPVVAYDEKTVVRALESLREKNLAYIFYGSESRVPKYKHVVPEVLHLTPQQVALMCVLMLRGPQTVGELRGRTNRLYEFTELLEVEATLEELIRHELQPLVARLPRQPGRKESRYAHLLSGPVEVEAQEAAPRPEAARREVLAENEKIARLEAEVSSLRGEVAELRQQFDDFRKQFE